MAGESSPLPVSLLHELEGHREDQNARAERHHHVDHALRAAGVEAQQRPDEERRTPDESPEPAVNASTRISLLIRFNAALELGLSAPTRQDRRCGLQRTPTPEYRGIHVASSYCIKSPHGKTGADETDRLKYTLSN